MRQCIECVCGKTFAACAEPYCYSDVDWQREMRSYVSKGCKVVLRDKNTLILENCTCKNFTPEETDKNQLKLF